MLSAQVLFNKSKNLRLLMTLDSGFLSLYPNKRKKRMI